MKRYVAERGSDVVRQAMGAADGWYMCRTGYVETARAVGLAGGNSSVRAFREEWPAFGVISVDQDLVEQAAHLARKHDLRSLDSLHLAAALLLQDPDLVVATWDRRLHAASQAENIHLLPERLG